MEQQSKPDNNVVTFKLTQFQADFVFNKEEFPAFHAGWGTGKTLCGILRAKIYSDMIPNNLGLICRKEYNDLADSTIRDFEDYTGLKVNSKRNVDLPNGSRIMFRHLEELLSDDKGGHNMLQNINLGWFCIEQSDELSTDRAFWLLWGRLRRKLKPSAAFEQLGLPPRSGWCIANVNGEDWNWRLWYKEPSKGFSLVEACTFDNAENLTKDFLERLEVIKDKKPGIYQRFVLNDRTAETDTRVFRNFKRLRAGTFMKYNPEHKYIGAFDPAKSRDYAAIMIINATTNHVDYVVRWNKSTVCANEKTYWSYCKERVKAIDAMFGNDVFWFMDATGVGDPVVEDLLRDGLHVFCDKEKERNGVVVSNTLKEQMVERAQIAIDDGHITYPHPDLLENDDAKEIIALFEEEMRQFKAEISSVTRNVRYAAPTGEHDDLVFVFIMALWGMFGEMYTKQAEKKIPTQNELFWARIKADAANNAPVNDNYETVIDESNERMLTHVEM